MTKRASRLNNDLIVNVQVTRNPIAVLFDFLYPILVTAFTIAVGAWMGFIKIDALI